MIFLATTKIFSSDSSFFQSHNLITQKEKEHQTNTHVHERANYHYLVLHERYKRAYDYASFFHKQRRNLITINENHKNFKLIMKNRTRKSKIKFYQRDFPLPVAITTIQSLFSKIFSMTSFWYGRKPEYPKCFCK